MKEKMTIKRKEALHHLLHPVREAVVADIETQIGRELSPILFRKITRYFVSSAPKSIEVLCGKQILFKFLACHHSASGR